MKRYFMEFDFVPVKKEDLPEDEGKLYGGCWDYTKQEHSKTHEYYGNGNSIKVMKSYISRAKKRYPSQKPHNFRIFDTWSEECELCGHVKEVYFQAE